MSADLGDGKEFVTWAMAPQWGGKIDIHRVDLGGHGAGPAIASEGPLGVPHPRISTISTLSTDIHLVYCVHVRYT
jgi:hypothetical protein